ncbi:putative VQ motif-containing protein [Helianthus annuus]|uniref:uncharacterized protein LOC110895929 n=1 Tax=Helianthus annuus TaxID=4232 RepID=UPI000B8FFE61|nr:uncharacterized protein LOC110895929 [Helianthus annuus]KAJ0494525.1 putative VQ motif-containing protein [Helianthus annuus]KAJ0867654.1 putative VQ motif-containing protein [Helianthus annuus]
MSGSNNPWLQFHQNNQPPTVQTTDHVTPVVTSPNPNPTGSNHLNRVTRPTIARKRSRASRKTPTTLLNTDTTNFRAMVQRFTGGCNTGGGDDSSVPFPVSSAHQVLNTYNTTSTGFSEGMRLNESHNMEFRLPNNQPYFTMMGDSGGATAAYDDDNSNQHMGFRQTGSFNLTGKKMNYKMF